MVNALQNFAVVSAQNVVDVVFVRVLGHYLFLYFLDPLDYLQVIHLVLND